MRCGLSCCRWARRCASTTTRATPWRCPRASRTPSVIPCQAPPTGPSLFRYPSSKAPKTSTESVSVVVAEEVLVDEIKVELKPWILDHEQRGRRPELASMVESGRRVKRGIGPLLPHSVDKTPAKFLGHDAAMNPQLSVIEGVQERGHEMVCKQK